MKKRIFGIKLGTVLTFFVCLVIAFAIWTVVHCRADVGALTVNVRVSDFLRG